MMVASSVSTDKGSGGKDVHPTEPPLVRVQSADAEDALAHEISMLDVALALGRGRAINCVAICGLLTECLEDVSFAILTMLYSFALLLGFLFLFVSVLGFKIDQSC
jgi:hypothetical protein